MNDLIIILFTAMILLNVGTLISIALMLNYEHRANINFRKIMLQYSRDLDMCDYIRRNVVYEENQIFMFIRDFDPNYIAFKRWLENEER